MILLALRSGFCSGIRRVPTIEGLDPANAAKGHHEVRAIPTNPGMVVVAITFGAARDDRAVHTCWIGASLDRLRALTGGGVFAEDLVTCDLSESAVTVSHENFRVQLSSPRGALHQWQDFTPPLTSELKFRESFRF